MIAVAEAKASSDKEDVKSTAGGEMLYGIRSTSEALAIAAGRLVRGYDVDGVRLAVVGTVYRQPHGSIWYFRDGSLYGIDDSQLALFVEELSDADIFERTRSRDIVRLTPRGRDWFDSQLVAAESAVADKADAEAWSDAKREIDDIESHLGFMASDELRDIAKSLLVEIDKNIRGQAGVAVDDDRVREPR